MASSLSFHNLQHVNKVDGVESPPGSLRIRPHIHATSLRSSTPGCGAAAPPGAFWRKGREAGRQGSSHESSRCFVVEMELVPCFLITRVLAMFRGGNGVGALLFNYVSHGLLVSDSVINDAARPPLPSFVDKMQRSAFLF
jgi:hypothetical protein